MKKLLPVLPLVAMFGASCQQSTPEVVTLPPVVERSTPAVTAKPKKKKTYTRSRTASKPKPKPKATATTTTKTESTITPLVPDPVKLPQVADIPRFEVPENIQPSVTDGINQGEFIELKW